MACWLFDLEVMMLLAGGLFISPHFKDRNKSANKINQNTILGIVIGLAC